LEKLETETAVSAELILHNAKIATNGVILGSGIWDAIVSPFEKWQPNS
jgi:hypothetical protein